MYNGLELESFKLAVATLYTDLVISVQAIHHEITPNLGGHLPQLQRPKLDPHRNLPPELQRHRPRLLLLLQRRHQVAPDLRLPRQRNRHH